MFDACLQGVVCAINNDGSPLWSPKDVDINTINTICWEVILDQTESSFWPRKYCRCTSDLTSLFQEPLMVSICCPSPQLPPHTGGGCPEMLCRFPVLRCSRGSEVALNALRERSVMSGPSSTDKPQMSAALSSKSSLRHQRRTRRRACTHTHTWTLLNFPCWNVFCLLTSYCQKKKKKESGSKTRHLIVWTSVTFISRFPKSRSQSTLFCFIKRNFKLWSWSSHVTLARFLFLQPITQTSAILWDPSALPPNSLCVAAYYAVHGGEACLWFIGDWEKHVARRNRIAFKTFDIHYTSLQV